MTLTFLAVPNLLYCLPFEPKDFQLYVKKNKCIFIIDAVISICLPDTGAHNHFLPFFFIILYSLYTLLHFFLIP